METTYEVKITRQAEAQLLDIVTYIATELKAPDAALHILDIVDAAIRSLARSPGRVALTDEEPWRSHGIHRLPVHNYLVYFWIDEGMRKVQVTAVIYGRRDQTKQLSNMDID